MNRLTVTGPDGVQHDVTELKVADDPSQHTLTYPGLVKPPEGLLMGPGLDGRVWKVIGSMYDTEADKTFVTVEEYQA